MKRIEVRPGKFVTISPALAEKMEAIAAARVGITRDQALEIAKAEPRGATIFAGPLVPGRPSRRRAGASSKKFAGKAPP
jgi:hypothetical protein